MQRERSSIEFLRILQNRVLEDIPKPSPYEYFKIVFLKVFQNRVLKNDAAALVRGNFNESLPS